MSFSRVPGSHNYTWDYIDMSIIENWDLVNSADLQEYAAYKEEFFNALYDPNSDGYMRENLGSYGSTPSSICNKMRSLYNEQGTTEYTKDQISRDYHSAGRHFYSLAEKNVQFDPKVPKVPVTSTTPIPGDIILSHYYAEYGQGEETEEYKRTLFYIMGNHCLPQYTYILPSISDSVESASILSYMMRVGLIETPQSATYSLTVQYLNKASDIKLADDYVLASLKYNEFYSVTSPNISGYTIDRFEQHVISGHIKSDKVVKVYYNKNKSSAGGKDTQKTNTFTTELSSLSVPTSLDRTKWDSRSDTYGTDCYFIRYEDGQVQTVLALPVFPEEFSDNNQIDYNSTTMLGRSVAYQTYNTSARTTSFNLILHEEIAIRGKNYYWTTKDNSTSEGTPFDMSTADGPDYDRVHSLVAQIQAACYPGYAEGAVRPPEVEFIIGSQFSIRGILTNCSASWKPPIINGHYVCCDLSIGVTETTGPYSAADIVKIRGKRGINQNA